MSGYPPPAIPIRTHRFSIPLSIPDEFHSLYDRQESRVE